MPSAPTPSIRVRTPHLTVLTAALGARDQDFEVLGDDALVIHGLAADDLGWLLAGAGVVVYELAPESGP